MGNLFRGVHRTRLWLFSIASVFVLGLVLVPATMAQPNNAALMRAVMAQSVADEGLGVGSGDGLEVGINVAALDQIKADIAAGVYDRPCTEAEHDPTKWHTLVNVQAKCHYDHQHGDDPHYADDLFGEPGAWFGNPGQSISYPWQTFPAQSATESNAAYLGTGKMENEAKHEGYVWVVRRDQPCNTSNHLFCIKDFRVQFHGDMHAHGAATRFHSMSAEVRACKDVNDLSTCGIIRTGGWMDFGRLYTSTPDSFGNVLCEGGAFNAGLLKHIALPVDNQYIPLDNPLSEERCHPQLTPAMIAAGPVVDQARSGPRVEWWTHGASDFRFQAATANPIGNVYETSPGSGQLVYDNFYCKVTDPECDWNQSLVTLRLQYIVPVSPFYVDGFIDSTRTQVNLPLGRRYIWRLGGLNRNCTSPGLDCIPIEYSHLMVSIDPGRGLAGYAHTACDSRCAKVDYDISPTGHQWITWFYKKYQGYTEPEPVPQPEEPTGPAIYFQVDDSQDQHVNVNVKLIGVDNVYGVQAECTVDPQVLAGGTLVEGDGFNSSNSFIIDDDFQADTGKWSVAASRLKPNPAISGDALAFTLPYDVLTSGDGNLQCSVLAVDQDGRDIAMNVVNGTVIIPPPVVVEEPPVEEPPVAGTGSIAGLAAYQNRPDNAGITVKLIAINNMVVNEITTGADGSYAFPDLPVGDYTVELLAPQHIPVVENATVQAADATVQLNDQLRAGDVDDNGVVNMSDITLVGANFGIQAISEISNVDLNGDGWITISDLSLAGGNLDLQSPIPIQ